MYCTRIYLNMNYYLYWVLENVRSIIVLAVVQLGKMNKSLRDCDHSTSSDRTSFSIQSSINEWTKYCRGFDSPLKKNKKQQNKFVFSSICLALLWWWDITVAYLISPTARVALGFQFRVNLFFLSAFPFWLIFGCIKLKCTSGGLLFKKWM